MSFPSARLVLAGLALLVAGGAAAEPAGGGPSAGGAFMSSFRPAPPWPGAVQARPQAVQPAPPPAPPRKTRRR